MKRRVPLYLVTLVFLAFSQAWGYGDLAGGEGAAGEAPGAREAVLKALEALTVTVELPGSAPYLKVIPSGDPVAKSSGDVVQLVVPVTSEKWADLPVADVGGEPITLDEFWRALRPGDEVVAEEDDVRAAAARAEEPMKLLHRLVDIRLVVREAEEMGLHELPEVRKFVDAFARRSLREQALQHYIRGVQADEGEIDRLYREATREWRIRGAVFAEEADARAFREAVAGGAAFSKAAESYVAESKAELKGGEAGEFLKSSEVSPEIAEQISGLETGAVTPVIPMKDGFGVIALEEVRFVESEGARAQARERALNFAQNTALEAYMKELSEKHVKLDEELFENLDFGGTADNFDARRADDTVVAEVAGEEPVRVSDLAQGIREKYYHGMDKAIESGAVNERKIPALNDILFRRLLLKDALSLGLDQSRQFRGALEDYEDSFVFGTFVEKVLKPEIRITMDDLKGYYERNVARYTLPEMIQLQSLSFTNAAHAQSALEKLRRGTGLRWIRANAEGQVAGDREDILRFGAGMVVLTSLPEAARRALEGAQEGEYALFAESDTAVHVLQVEKRVPGRVQSLEEVQQDAVRELYAEKVEASLRDWTRKLGEAYGVDVYAKEFSTP